MRNIFYQKIFSIIVLFVLIFLPISKNLEIKRAEAVLGVADVTFVDLTVVTDPITLGFYSLALTNQELQLAVATGEITFNFTKFAQKVAGQILKKLILDRLVDALIAYISGQTNSIIEDWGEFFDQAADQAVGLVAQELGAGFLCSNFDLNLRLTLLPVKQFSKGTTCSLTGIIGNIDSFIENFENGSWIGYQEQWYPQNNFYGATLTALDEVSFRTAKAKDAAQTEGLAGGGFLSQKKCDSNGLNCRIITPGDYVGDQVKALVGPKRDFWAIITADDIAAYTVAIVNAGVNRLAKMGIDGLRGVLKKSTSDFTTVTPATPCAGLTGEAFRACVDFQRTSTNSLAGDRFTVLGQINQSLKPRQDGAQILEELITNQTELVEALASLTACRPSDLNVQNQLAQEQGTLDEIQNKFDDNQTFLEPLQNAADTTNNAQSFGEASNALVSSLSLADIGAANDFLSSAKEDQATIQANIDAKLPGVKDQLKSCSGV